jgi:hypothetical protein
MVSPVLDEKNRYEGSATYECRRPREPLLSSVPLSKPKAKQATKAQHKLESPTELAHILF